MRSPTFIAAALLLGGLFTALPASAQSCPAGTTPSPGGPGGPVPCIPISDYSGGGSSGPVYATRWGAFASDTKSGAIGVATGLGSKGKAEKAAVAWGDGTLQASSAARKEEAEQRALGLCARDGSVCEIFFSECSYAELVG
jgi:hypothetical protein